MNVTHSALLYCRPSSSCSVVHSMRVKKSVSTAASYSDAVARAGKKTGRAGLNGRELNNHTTPRKPYSIRSDAWKRGNIRGSCLGSSSDLVDACNKRATLHITASRHENKKYLMSILKCHQCEQFLVLKNNSFVDPRGSRVPAAKPRETRRLEGKQD